MPGKSSDYALRLEAIINTAIDGIITISDRGIIQSVNPAGARLFGYPKEEIVGENISKLMPEPYHSQHDGYIENYKRTAKPKIIGIGREVIGKKKDGVLFPFRLAVSEVRLENEVIFTGVIHDLTAVKEAEKELLDLNRELESKVLERTQQLEDSVKRTQSINKLLQEEITEKRAVEESLRFSQEELKAALDQEKELGVLKSRFVSMASHEFRTPLTSIKSSASLIRRYHESSHQSQREKHVLRIEKTVNDLILVLNDFLSLGRLDEGNIENQIDHVSLDKLFTDIVETICIGEYSDRQINLHFNELGLHVWMDEKIVRNILLNLYSNALKYSDSAIDSRILVKDDQLIISIQDYGIGIPEVDQQYLFSRFFRAHNATHIAGTGLGLNIVKDYLDILGGSIDYTTKENEGTKFTVTIPMRSIEK